MCWVISFGKRMLWSILPLPDWSWEKCRNAPVKIHIIQDNLRACNTAVYAHLGFLLFTRMIVQIILDIRQGNIWRASISGIHGYISWSAKIHTPNCIFLIFFPLRTSRKWDAINFLLLFGFLFNMQETSLKDKIYTSNQNLILSDAQSQEERGPAI